MYKPILHIIRIMGVGMGLLVLVLSVRSALADGTETLGPASITIQEGTDIAAFGTGLIDGQPQDILVSVPDESTVTQALLYWGDRYPDGGAVDDTATVSINGGSPQEIAGTLIGGPTPPAASTYRSIAYRADITGLIGAGDTTVSVGGLNFGGTDGTDGAEVVVVLDDGGMAAGITVRDGSDYANAGLQPGNDPLGIFVPQTYTFLAAEQARDARVIIFGGDAQAGRTDTVNVLVDGSPVLTLIDQLASSNGNQWDTLNMPLSIPAGATSLTVEVESGSTGVGNPDSFNWIGSLLALQPVPLEPIGCRVTAGINDNYDTGDGVNRYRAGGQAGAHTALQPQPAGEWTHRQRGGPAGRFTFHGGTASAPAGTEIDDIRCSDPGTCTPSGDPPSPAKQIDFDGIGTFKNIGSSNRTPDFVTAGANVTAEGHGNTTFDGTFHWFEVNMDDLGEPGNSNPEKNPGDGNPELCPSIGFGEKGARPLAETCDCSDFYRITIYDGVNAADVEWLADGSIDPESMNREDVIYQVWGYLNGGNIQIHHLTGFDTN